MLLIPKHEAQIDRLANKLQTAETPTPDLVAEILAGACKRIASLNKSGGAALQIDRLAGAAAWTDLSLALIAAELPEWTVRRLAHEDGAWFCSLSKRPTMPIELDETADASHENLPLAILSALIEARRRITGFEPRTQTTPRVAPAQGFPVWCDNFA